MKIKRDYDRIIDEIKKIDVDFLFGYCKRCIQT